MADFENSQVRKRFSNAVGRVELKCDHDECRKTVFVHTIPIAKFTEANRFLDHCAKFGKMLSTKFDINWGTDKGLGSAVIRYMDANSAISAVTSPENEYFHRMSLLPYRKCFQTSKTDKKLQSDEQSVGDDSESHISNGNFNNLSDDMINYIFSFLPFHERIRGERVCKRWQYVNKNVAWVGSHGLNLKERFGNLDDSILTDDILISILKRCGSTLRDISINFYNHSLDRDYPIAIYKYCPNLKTVNLGYKPVSDTAIRGLLQACKNIEVLSLQNCEGVDEECVTWILRLLGANLKYLNVSDNQNISGECFRLLKHNNKLQSLILDNCNGLSFDNLHNYLKFSKIQELSLSYNLSLSDSHVVRVIEVLKPTLRKLLLEASFCSRRSVRQMLSHCENLVFLSLEKTGVDCNDEIMSLIPDRCPQLSYLNISDYKITDDSVRTLYKLPNLRTLLLNYNQKISDDSLICLSIAGILEHVELRGCFSIGDDGCVALIKNCHKLRLLDISNCDKVTNKLALEASNLQRLDNTKLEIIAGASAITVFFEKEFVRLSSENLCPSLYRQYSDKDFLDDLSEEEVLLD